MSKKAIQPVLTDPFPQLRIVLTMLPPTINHMYKNNYGGGKRLTDEANTFYALAGYETRSTIATKGWIAPKRCPQLTVAVGMVFSDRRFRDTDNRLKAAQDGVFKAMELDDINVRLILGLKIGYDKHKPICEIVISEYAGPVAGAHLFDEIIKDYRERGIYLP